jgi:hypothetical protein
MKKRISLSLILVIVVSMTLLPAIARTEDSSDEKRFDTQECYSRCECRHGMFLTCSECKAACDREFWKWWTGKMKRAAEGPEPKASTPAGGRHRTGR